MTIGTEIENDVARIENLRVRFSTDQGDFDAVKKACLTIDQGEILALVGESGSGKSVTSKAILQMLPDSSIESGTVLLRSDKHGLQDVQSLNPEQLREIRGKDAAMVFQEPSTALNPVYKIGWQIAEGIRAHTQLFEGRKLTNAEARKRAIEILEKVGIPSPETRVDYYPHQFSGGQKQRIVIAQALALGAKLIIADEPTSALDVSVQKEVLKLFLDLQDELQFSCLFISHDLAVIDMVSDSISVLYHGEILEKGHGEQILTNPQHDYTKKLLASLPVPDPKIQRA